MTGRATPESLEVVGALEIGGTHVTSALVDRRAGLLVPGTVRRSPIDPVVGQDIYVAGDIASLGAWDPTRALKLSELPGVEARRDTASRRRVPVQVHPQGHVRHCHVGIGSQPDWDHTLKRDADTERQLAQLTKLLRQGPPGSSRTGSCQAVGGALTHEARLVDVHRFLCAQWGSPGDYQVSACDDDVAALGGRRDRLELGGDRGFHHLTPLLEGG